MLKRKLYLTYQKYVSNWTRKIHSQYGEDIIIEELLDRKRNGIYIDVGAHHPFHYSNTALLRNKRGWRGINIEPNPNLFDLFLKHRSDDTNLNCGVSAEPGMMKFYEMDDSLMSSFDKAEVDKNVKRGIPILSESEVEVKPLQAIIEEHLEVGKKIDVLNIDVEGHDFVALKSIDLEKNSPGIIIIEDHTFSIESPGDIYSYLKNYDYKLVSLCKYSLIFQKK